MVYDVDQINDLIDEIRDIRSDLRTLTERAGVLGLELDEDVLTGAIELGEKWAALLHEAGEDDLKRAYERMSL